ncbi:MAG: TonB-dependent receptor [Acidobacteriia bacterium]|nr:TonB-dependent receptor [Terriglobia bacterium]
MKRTLCALLGLALMLVCSAKSWGQAQITTGTVQGDIADEKGGSVPDAAVEIRNLDTNFTRAEKTGADGHFALLNLPPGRYTLTVTKPGFAIVEQQNLNLTVGQTINLSVTLKVSAVSERVVVSDVPVVETTKSASSSTLGELAVSQTPVLGRKFEDLLTLTPGVSIVQGPDGDEINFNGQRGIFNNISLDGGDYNNGFFGEQMGGQRAAIDITLDAVKEFQVVAAGANAEFGRTAGGVVNVVTKSGTNDIHGSLFYYQRLEALTAATSDGKPLDNFHREQFGGTLGGPIKKNKLFYFGSAEGIREIFRRSNLSAPLGAPCAVSNPVFNSNITDAQIAASPDCQRQVLLKFFQTQFSQNEGLPVDHTVRNAAILSRLDWNPNAKNQLSASYNFDWSKNPNQTFDVPTYGTSANGIEGPSRIQAINGNWFSTVTPRWLNEAHFTYARENRPRLANPSSVPDTAMGFGTTFRFGQPFFLEPAVDELFWRTDARDSFTYVRGKHTAKFGGEWVHSNNTQVFRGFFTGRYIFDSVTGFLHYAAPPISPGVWAFGFGPRTVECSDGSFGNLLLGCAGTATITGGPLLLYLQHGPTTAGETPDQSGFSSIANNEFAIFAQDSWQLRRGLTFNYGLRWEAQHFPSMTIPPSQTSYGVYLNNPSFPSNGTLPNQNKMFQPRLGLAWDILGHSKSVLRVNYGIYNARQNMLTQVGAITTNGVQQQGIAAGTFFNTAGGPPPTYPNTVPIPLLPPGTPAAFAGVTVFSRDYANPRIYTTNVAYEQSVGWDMSVYADFTWSKGVHLTRFINPNVSPATGPAIAAACAAIGATLQPPGICVPTNGDTVTYPSAIFGLGVAKPFPLLGDITDTVSSAKSLYRGVTFGLRKRYSHRYEFDWNYTYSVDKDDDSNERDPFSFRYANLYNLASEYSNSDRDQRHRINFYTVAELPWGFQGNIRMQAHSAQPITPEPRFVNGVDQGRNTLRKDNAYFAFNFGLERTFRFGERMQLIPRLEMFNTFNNKNNVNPLSSPALFDFNGFLRVGVGDPRQAQLSVRFKF